jgi:hypothetical protein
LVVVSCRRYSEHLGEPEREDEGGAGLEGCGGVVVEVAEVGSIVFEGAGDFLPSLASAWEEREMDVPLHR